jgi:hypothetical protein
MLEIERLSAKPAGFDDNGFANYIPFEFRLGAGNAGNCRARCECISLQIECSRVEKRRQASSLYFIGLSARMISDAPHPAYRNLSAKLASMKVVHNMYSESTLPESPKSKYAGGARRRQKYRLRFRYHILPHPVHTSRCSRFLRLSAIIEAIQTEHPLLIWETALKRVKST